MADENVNLKEHIRRIASKLGIVLDPDFDLRELSNDLPEESFVRLALKLMETKCTFVLRNDKLFGDLSIHILRELLIRYHPDEIDLTGLMTFSKTIYTKYYQLKILATEAFQNIKAIRVFSDGPEKYFGNKLKSEALKDVTNDMKAFQNLRELQFDAHSFHLNEVMDICSKVPTLEHINVILGVKKYPEREKLITKLGNLKAFQCVEMKDQDLEIYSKFLMMCVVNLAKLQLIGKPCSPFCTNYKIVKSDELGSTTTTTSSLRHLNIDKWMNRNLKFLQRFPEVSHLKVDFNGMKNYNQELERTKIFEKVQSLNLQKVTKQTMFHFLKTYGYYLRELHAVIDERDDSPSGMFFTRIWLNCPNLEKVFVNYQTDEKCFSTYQIALLAVSNINELKIDWKTMMSTITVTTAPELRKMEMNCEGFHSSFIWYLENLCKDITQKKILQQLEHLTIDMHWFRPDQVNENHLKVLSVFVKFVADNLPKLSVIKFKLNYRCDVLKLAKALKDAKTTIEEIQEIFLLLDEETVKSLRCSLDDTLIDILEKFNE